MSAPTPDEMLAEITAACASSRVMPASDPGMTATELAKAWGCGEAKARGLVYAAVEAGKLIKGTRWFVDRANRTVSVPVYRAA